MIPTLSEKNIKIFKNGNSGDSQDFLQVPSGSTELAGKCLVRRSSSLFVIQNENEFFVKQRLFFIKVYYATKSYAKVKEFKNENHSE